ncbi:MAG: hypothetical protein LBT26_07370 [Clostridiales Family XIII bacterium]|jgi:hypothetical protein|nr:hypothetical protein [Clostridiales Family XIII bacterium]
MIIQSKTKQFIKTVLPALLFVVALVIFVFVVTRIAGRSETEGMQLTYESVRRAAVQCYALEGIYPSDFDYLKEHYGLRPDEGKYIILYDYVASNLMPDITVVSAAAAEPVIVDVQ